MRRPFLYRPLLVLISSAAASLATLFGFKLLRRVREEERHIAPAETDEPTPTTPLRMHVRETARETVATAARPMRWAAARIPFRDQLAALPPARRMRGVHISPDPLRHTAEAAWAAARRAPVATRAVAERARPPALVRARVHAFPGQATRLLTHLRRSPNGRGVGHNSEA